MRFDDDDDIAWLQAARETCCAMAAATEAEDDPAGLDLRERARTAAPEAAGPPILQTIWNAAAAWLNGEMPAASFEAEMQNFVRMAEGAARDTLEVEVEGADVAHRDAVLAGYTGFKNAMSAAIAAAHHSDTAVFHEAVAAAVECIQHLTALETPDDDEDEAEAE